MTVKGLDSYACTGGVSSGRKMKFISIVGPKEEIDRVTSQYLSRYEIQLENTLSELKDLKNITPCADSNPYRGVLARAEELAGRVREIGNAAPSGKEWKRRLLLP